MRKLYSVSFSIKGEKRLKGIQIKARSLANLETIFNKENPNCEIQGVALVDE